MDISKIQGQNNVDFLALQVKYRPKSYMKNMINSLPRYTIAMQYDEFINKVFSNFNKNGEVEKKIINTFNQSRGIKEYCANKNVKAYFEDFGYDDSGKHRGFNIVLENKTPKDFMRIFSKNEKAYINAGPYAKNYPNGSKNDSGVAINEVLRNLNTKEDVEEYTKLRHKKLSAPAFDLGNAIFKGVRLVLFGLVALGVVASIPKYIDDKKLQQESPNEFYDNQTREYLRERFKCNNLVRGKGFNLYPQEQLHIEKTIKSKNDLLKDLGIKNEYRKIFEIEYAKNLKGACSIYSDKATFISTKEAELMNKHVSKALEKYIK